MVLLMRVLKRGVKKEEIKYIGKCYSCSSIIGANGAEVLFKYDQRDGNYNVVSCPVCNGNIGMFEQSSQQGKDLKRQLS